MRRRDIEELTILFLIYVPFLLFIVGMGFGLYDLITWIANG